MNSLAISKKQRGATLLVSLALLLVLTILALTAARNATLQQRMASNLQQQNLAFQFAENGIQAAILQLQDENSRPLLNAPQFIYSASGTGLSAWTTEDCRTKDDAHYYCAEVEQVECTAVGGIGSGSSSGASSIGVNNNINLTGGSCYRITSTGRFESSTAMHQQGYMF